MTKRMNARAAGGVEYRTIGVGGAEADDSGKLTGLAVRFDSPTMIGEAPWGFRESFAAGAFTKTLGESDVVLLDNHDTAKPVARKSAGTLTLSQAEGLRWDASPTANTSYVNDLRENIKAKNYGGCSFGFRAIKEDWLDDDGRPSDAWSGTQRVVREAQLFEVSVCTFPAYTDTEVNTRAAVLGRPVERPEADERAAKASYSDLDTCGECGTTNQYGQYCTNCGEPMQEPKTAGKFCSSCGGSLDGNRSHTCFEERAEAANTDTIPEPEDSTQAIDIRKYRFRLESTRVKEVK